MSQRNPSWPHIKNYHPLDPARDAIWIPVPKGCCSTLVGVEAYSVSSTLEAWGVSPVLSASSKLVQHPEDNQIQKFTLPEGWGVFSQGRNDWLVVDQSGHGRISLSYRACDLDYIVGSWVRTPFDLQVGKIRDDERPPRDWYFELFHLGRVVFETDAVDPYADLRASRLGLGEEAFWESLKLHDTDQIMQPLMAQAMNYLRTHYPLFPADPTAYW
jgi:hypothetical protein